MKAKIFIGFYLFLDIFSTVAQQTDGLLMNSRPAFIENKGQIIDQNNKSNPAVLYLLNTPGMNVQLRRGGFSYDIFSVSSPPAGEAGQQSAVGSPPAGEAGQQSAARLPARQVSNQQSAVGSQQSAVSSLNQSSSVLQPPSSIFHYHRIDFDMEGINPDYTIETSEPSSDYLNYYTTGTPVNGITGVRYYKTITYKNIYHGIDMEFIMTPEQGYKYNFVVHPEGKVSDIKLNITGTDHIQFTRDTLKFTTSLGVVDELIPESYFLNDDSRTFIKSHFLEIGGGVYGFSLDGDFPETSTLVIDPTSIRSWGTYYGGSGNDNGYTVSVDNEHNVILAGSTYSSTNIATTGAYDTIKNAFYDMYIAKFTADGVRLWGTYYGGDGSDGVMGAATDLIGNIYITGMTNSNSYIATSGSFQDTCSSYNNLGPSAGYLAKFSPNGWRIWGTYYGGWATDGSHDVDLDQDGNVYIAGETAGTDGLGTPGAYQLFYNNTLSGNGFLAKFDSSGARIWGTYYGTGCLLTGISIDSFGIVYAAGSTRSLQAIASPGAYQTVYGGGESDAFLVAFTLTGQRLWATYYGGPLKDGEQWGGSPYIKCKADNKGDVHLTGTTESLSGIASAGGHQETYGGGSKDGFMAKFNFAGQRIWGTYYGGAGYESVHSCSPGWNGDVFFTGESNSPDGIATADSYMPSINGGTDAFLVKFNPAGQRQWGTYFGGTGGETALSSGYVADDTIYFSGTTISTTNIASAGAHSVTLQGGVDAFLEKFIECWPIAPAQPITGTTSVCQGTYGLAYSTDSLVHAVSYEWTLPPGATITTGLNTTHIIVDFSSSASSGIIMVKGINKCGKGGDSAALFITVNIHPVPLITGPDTTCTGSGKVYSTAPGKTGYQWSTSPGGTVTAGDTTATATITWSVPGDQQVYVTYSENGCQALTPSVLDVWVNSGPPVDISIAPSANNVCAGTPVTFTATPVNGGTNPFYQWKVNGVIAGGNSPVFTYSPLNGDQVICVLTSDAFCSLNNPATSNTITMIVNPNLPVSILVSLSANPVCAGSAVTFTATPTNGGTSPQYQWKVNGANAGTNDSVYTYVPVNGDSVRCILTSSESCTSCNPVSSSQIQMVVNSILPVGIVISASANPVCMGIPVTFTATPTNGGTSPQYQWKVNGINAGTNSPFYTYVPSNGDSVRCVLTSSESCTSCNPVSSNPVSMSVSNAPVVTFTRCFDSITTINAKPIKLKGGIPLGGTYSGPGVNSITGVFTPAFAGMGTHTLIYTYTNAALCTAQSTLTIVTRNASPVTCGNNFTDIRDNKIYPTIQIGSQCWMASNLNYGNRVPGTGHQRDNCVPEKYCYNDLTGNCELGTANYQWDELMQYQETPGLQGLCPPAWHIPTETEWNTLFSNWTNNAFAGAPLKYSGYSGFNALLSGVRHLNVQWDYQDFAIFFWSSTPYNAYKAWAHGMNNFDPSVAAYPALRSNAFSARCLRD